MTKKNKEKFNLSAHLAQSTKECMRNRIKVRTYVFTCREYKDKLGDYILFLNLSNSKLKWLATKHWYRKCAIFNQCHKQRFKASTCREMERKCCRKTLYNAKTVYKAKEVEVDNFFFLSDKKIKLKPETSVHEK